MARTHKERVSRMSEAASKERTQVKAERPAQLPAQPSDPSNRIAELQVSAHLMSLESGLFCVFQTPGSAPPDPATGLPGVRITPAPGIAGRPEAVSVSTFREDGWLNGTAALVRVTDGSAQILVTIYQHKGMDAAPRLQVLRLSGDPATPDAPAAAVTTAVVPSAELAEASANPEIMAHIQRAGDIGCKIGEWLGTKGSRQWIEGFGMAPSNGIALEDVEYQAVLGRNWLSPWVEGGKLCGSRGMALPLLGIKVRLKGEAAKAYDCRYSATFVDGSAIGPVSAGETCEAESLAVLESFQIDIHPRAGKTVAKVPAAKTAPAKTPAPVARAASKPPAGRRIKR
jgi:hypothetical protein